MQDSLNVLVVVAHPHDFTHCSGTCGIHVARGDRVTVVAVTDGSETHNEKLHDELLKPEAERDPQIVGQSKADYAAQKAREFGKVCGLFGVQDVRVLGYTQPFRLVQMPEVVESLRDIFYDVRPQVLITQRGTYDGRNGEANLAFDDHNETAIAVLEAQALASKADYERQIRPHTVAASYYMGIYYTRNEIDLYVDISDWYEQRVEAETLFESQSQTAAFARKRVEIGAGTMGWSAHVPYAEGYVRAAPEVQSYLMVAEKALQRAAEPRQNQLRRMSGELDEE